ncbi:MAG: hypothetical protein NTY34_01150, partial [Candidatus Omnitrophica bacterium]|nr:hypothetical protein [Candidatus Omnitrophota bacterium]
RSYIIEELVKDSIGYLKVVYPKPVSFTMQRAEVVPFYLIRRRKKRGPVRPGPPQALSLNRGPEISWNT